jgi:hypothetical protein
MHPFTKINVWPLSAAAFRPVAENGKPRSPFVVIGKSNRKRDSEEYEDASILLNAAEVPAMIRLLQRLESEVITCE